MLLAVLGMFVNAYEMRTWTATNGKTTEAAYVKYEYDSRKVVMQKRDGSIIKVNRDSLCDEDWIYVLKYDPSIFEIFVLLGKTTCDLYYPDGSKPTSKETLFYASNTGMIRIVREGITIAEAPFVSSVFPPFSDDGPLSAARYDYSRDPFGDPFALSGEQSFDIPGPRPDAFDREMIRSINVVYYRSGSTGQNHLNIHVFAHHNCQHHNRTNYRGCSIGINAASGKQYRAIRSRFGSGEVSEKDFRLAEAVIKSQIKDSWITLTFDSRNDSEIRHLRDNTLALDSLLQQNARFSRISTLLNSRNHGVPPVGPGPRTELDQGLTLLATGSGFFITADGYFLTNYHVVQGAKNIRLRTVFGNVSAKVVRVDPEVDLALLKANKRGFVPLPFAAEDSATLGEDIFTIGFPMPDLQGFSPKMTKGVISSLNGIQDDDVEYQIDASIQPGNSGGPLVNNQGELVGVVAASLREGLVAEKKGVLPQNVNYAIKKKHILDFLSQVPDCLDAIQTSNQPSTGKSATSETIEAVQNSCAMVVVFE